MNGKRNQFHYGLGDGFGASALLGCIGAGVCAGITALFGGPVVIVAAVGAGLFGLLGAAGSALGAATSGTGDYRASWAAGIPTTALLVAGILALGSDAPAPKPPVKDPTTVTQQFNGAVSKISTSDAASCVPKGSYPVNMMASKGPLAPGG
jgi:hypothetical protein